MKLIIMFLLFGYTANATNYYISNSGSDAANGLTSGTAWQHVSKVNSFSFSNGDSILFNRGDSWNEQFNVPHGNIYIGAYGSGVKPVITGFATATMASIGSNLYTSTLSDGVKYQNTVLVNGVIRAKGRYPNSTYLLTNAGSSVDTIHTALTGTPNYTGGELVLSTLTYMTDVSRIKSQSAGLLILVEPVGSVTFGNNRFFIQNLPSLCDVQNEWAYDSTTKLLTVYSTSLPVVKYSNIDTVIHIYKKDYVTLENLTVEGANSLGIFRDTSNHVTIKNCTIKNTGGVNPNPITLAGLGGAGIRSEKSTYAANVNDSLMDNLNNGIFDIHQCSYDSTMGCYIHNTGMLPGMACGSNGAEVSIFLEGHRGYIYNNKIFANGYIAIEFYNSDTTLIKYNYADSSAANKADGGIIYTVFTGSEGSEIKSNIVTNGLTGGGNDAPGIGLDGNSRYITIDSNTTDHTYLQGLGFHYPDHVSIFGNTFCDDIGNAFYYSAGGSGSVFSFTNNIFYSSDTTWPVYNLYYGTLFSSSSSNNNYFPSNFVNQFYEQQHHQPYSLTDWISHTTYEANSSLRPTGVTSALGTLYINPTLNDSTVTLSGRYLDAKGNIYDNQITIHPFQSALLFYASTQPTATYHIGNLIFSR